MEIAKTNDVPMYAPAGLNQTLLTLGLMPAKLVPRMSKGGTIEPFPGVKMTMVRAEHSSEMIRKDPATGKDTSYAAGEPAGYDHRARERLQDLPHGRHRPVRRHEVHRRLLQARPRRWCRSAATSCSIPKDAAYAMKELVKPKMAWPMHYASNPFLKGTPAEFKGRALGQTTIQVIDAEPGMKKEF